MKHSIFLSLIFVLISLTACDGRISLSADPPPIPMFFSAEVLIEQGDTEIKALLKKETIGINAIKVIAPESLEGMEIQFDGELCKLTLGELVLDLSYSNFPQTAFFKIIMNTLRRMNEDMTITVSKNMDLWEYQLIGEQDNEIITVVQSDLTGFLESMHIPSCDLTVTFSNFTELQSNL